MKTNEFNFPLKQVQDVSAKEFEYYCQNSFLARHPILSKQIGATLALGGVGLGVAPLAYYGHRLPIGAVAVGIIVGAAAGLAGGLYLWDKLDPILARTSTKYPCRAYHEPDPS